MAQDTYSDTSDNPQKWESSDIISSRKVEGTAVYNHDGERLGTIESFMVNKRSGQVDYAVLQFGGLFGIGSDYYPIPWRQLRYSPDHGGYIVSVDRTALDKAPRYSAPDDQDFDTAYGREVTNYYSSYPPI